eukprot:3822336-Pyramimonas_sp.AAC.2
MDSQQSAMRRAVTAALPSRVMTARSVTPSPQPLRFTVTSPLRCSSWSSMLASTSSQPDRLSRRSAVRAGTPRRNIP